MKISEIRWKGMHPAGLMKGLSQYLGTDDLQELVRVLRTDPGRIMQAPGMGKKCLRKIMQVLKEAGHDVGNVLII